MIFGEPGYYPEFGFQTCDHYGITTAEGKNFDAFMGIELSSEALKEHIYYNIQMEKLEAARTVNVKGKIMKE